MSLLVASDPAWPALAVDLAAPWRDTVAGVRVVHHIGSTAVPGLPAKPVIDLLPVFDSLDAMEAARLPVEKMGYEWLGEYGLPGRRYARRDTDTGSRQVQAHCYVDGSPAITRHLAFRDALRSTPALRAAYTAEKARCAGLYAGDAAAYGACKSGWIDKAEARALERLT
ncbi:MAG: GrpB family protein [Pseudomonadota bacterium]